MLLILVISLLLAANHNHANAFVTSTQTPSKPLVQQQPLPSAASRPSSTIHSLVPYSVATTFDAWAFSMPNVSKQQRQATDNNNNDYTWSLQQQSAPAWSRRRRLVFPQDGDVSFGDNQLPSPLIPLVVRPRTTTTISKQQPFRVYCDLDGVLVDFCHGIRTLFPHHKASQSVDALHRPTMWQKVAAQPAFFAHLPWMPEGRKLWQAIRPLQPDILTGVPYRVTRSSIQKYDWCRRELGVPVQHIDKAFGKAATRQQDTETSEHNAPVCRVITTWSDDKHIESGPGAVLIDDRIELRAAWEAKGGIFIHHVPGKADHTLAQLRYHGILPATQD